MIAVGCGESKTAKQDKTTLTVLGAIMDSAKGFTQQCPRAGDIPDSTYRKPPDCGEVITPSDLNLKSVAEVHEHPDVDVSTLQILVGEGDSIAFPNVTFQLRSPSGHMCTIKPGEPTPDTCGKGG
jgi:hypothetical protein